MLKCQGESRDVVRGRVHMTSSKFLGFWTVPDSHNLPSFRQNLANPLLPLSADVICISPLIKSVCAVALCFLLRNILSNGNGTN